MKAIPAQLNSISWQELGAELVFTQDRNGKYLSFYWQAAQYYGLSNEQIVGRDLEDTFAPTTREVYKEKIRRVLTRRIPEQCHCIFEYQGQSFPLELVISPILPSQGEAKAVLVNGHLLKEQENSLNYHSALLTYPASYQQVLREIARKIRSTLDLVEIWQQTVNNLGEALQVSRCLMFSYNEKTEKVKVEAEYRQPECKSLLGYQVDLLSEPHLKQAISWQELVEVDFIVPHTYEQKSVLVVATSYQNQLNGLICLQQCNRQRNWNQAEKELVKELVEQVGTAIAHAKLYQELEQATITARESSQLKSEFLASTTHELRTPLNGIIGFLKLIIDGMADDPDEEREFINEAHNSAIHLLNLINDILDIAKIEAGKMDLDLTDVELNYLFLNVEKKISSQAQQKKLSFKLKVPPTYDQIILYGNYQRLLQVMLNLVGNAIKFTHEGGITISAEVVKKKIQRDDQEFPGMVKINVADTGIGVSLDQQDKLFQNFVQVDGGRTREYAGTGLGLAISQKLVEAMGGKIFFYSMGEGLGSTVTFTVPLNYVPVMKTVEQDDDSVELAS